MQNAPTIYHQLKHISYKKIDDKMLNKMCARRKKISEHSPKWFDVVVFSSRFTEINSFMHARWKLIYCRRCVFCSKLFFTCRLGMQRFQFSVCRFFLFLREEQTRQRRNVFDMHITAFHVRCFFFSRKAIFQATSQSESKILTL